MPGTDMPQHPTLVHQILLRAHSLVIASENEEDSPLADLLARAADHVQAEDGEHLDPHALTRAVAETAAQLLARCKIPVTAGDPNAAYYLQTLDQLPRTARAGLLTVAIRYTAPDPHSILPAAKLAPAPGRQTAPRGPMRGACRCPCNSGGFLRRLRLSGCGGR
ncbi:hypothetical protein [Streptomyces sp. NPDC021562]|uniref:hypothetical protein n=1 Tax=Streptomyces sp. NPDC021562 TaxID=3155121 RepID=UPI003410F02E